MLDRLSVSAFLMACAIGISPSQAQDTAGNAVPFAGGTLTITETQDLEKVLAFDQKELARDYVLYYDRTVDLGGTQVALFDIGPGGNQCGTATLIVWKPEGEELKTAQAGDDCGSPPPAIAGNVMYFVPYLLPGESAPVEMWTDHEGLRIVGDLAYAPQPGTTWADIDRSRLGEMINVFSNEAVYEAASALLGDELTHVATGLTVSDGIHPLESGIFYSAGCVPHACGVSNAFMAVDQAGKKLYFAQQDGEGGKKVWPDESGWPADVRDAMTGTLAP